MYSVYAVKISNGEKHRLYIDTYEHLNEAKHVANCYSLGTADYAYVKEIGNGGTIFFIRNPAYETTPLDQVDLRLP